MALAQAHKGYEYQDLLVAVRLIDRMLGSIVGVCVDEKLVPNDIFDDLTTVDDTGCRERVQIKYTTNASQALTPVIFTQNVRGLRLDRVISAVLADRDKHAGRFKEVLYRIVMRYLPPADSWLCSAQQPASPDPGPFVRGMNSVRMRFCTNSLDEYFGNVRARLAIDEADLEWVFEHLILELDAPDASFDLTSPGPAEELLLKRVQNDVGAGVYPNTHRSVIDVAEALIRSARAARQELVTPSISDLLRRTQLRSDFGAVARAHPVDSTIEVRRNTAVKNVIHQITAAADEGKFVLLVGPPGQGKSWICQQVVDSFSENEWFVAEHYCYLGNIENVERLSRVHTESVIGSLLQRIADADPEVVSEQRPRFAASEQALENAVFKALEKNPSRRVALVIDGIDHVTRVIGKAPETDPSFTMAEALAALVLPRGSTLIVLSQPGRHLKPLEAVESVTIRVPSLTDGELRQLAVRLGVLDAPSDGGDTDHSINESPLAEKGRVNEFVATLSDRSKGNALYATYLCKEVLRNRETMAMPSETIRQLPQFDESLSSYYRHILTPLEDKGAWVADVLALLDFPVSRDELKAIRPDTAHRVGEAIEILQPVLLERATQAGISIYHESFARFLRESFQECDNARTALLDRIIEWLEERGMFEDTRAYRHLLPILFEANYQQKIVDLVDLNFVVKSIIAGYPKSAIIENLATAVRSAAYTKNWPAVIRYVEMSRSAEAYQEERFQSLIVGYVDVIASLLGKDSLAEKLLHDGHPTMDAQSGLQMCAALDALGAIPPWQEYMRAYIRQQGDDHSNHRAASAKPTNTDWVRGRFRLAQTQPQGSSDAFISGISAENSDSKLYSPLNWKLLARQIDENYLSPRYVVEAILDTLGERALVEFIEKLSHSGPTCLEFAKAIAAGKASELAGSASDWAKRAAKCDLPSGHAYCLMALGVDVDQISHRPVQKAQKNLLSLTRKVQDYTALGKTGLLREWMDACSVAAANDPLGLASAKALLEDPGWYICWLRFTIALVSAEAASNSKKSHLSLAALRILTTSQKPLPDKPRVVDLFPIRFVIYDTFKRAVDLLDDQAWKEGISLLIRVCDANFMGLSSPIRRDRFLNLIIETATPTRGAVALAYVRDEIENSRDNNFYSDLAELRLIAARLALKINDPTEARRHWTDACRLLVAYGWRKDTTIFELLDPLHTLINVDPARGRAAVAKIQPLCERVRRHTDGKGTYRARSQWWQLLAEADPCALARLVQQRLLTSCNDPNELLHGARSDLWRTWYHRADPIVAGALRLTLNEPLDEKDRQALSLLAELCNGTGTDQPSQLMMALLARADERPVKYSDSNSSELLDLDSKLVDDLNSIATRVRAPRIGSLPMTPIVAGDSAASNRHPRPRAASRPTGQVNVMFNPGRVGIAQAVRAWQDRQYDEPLQGGSVDRFANILGYRIIELIGEGREGDAQTAVRSIAYAGKIFEVSTLLRSLADGFERHGAVCLAALAFTLVWTRARAQGGWLNFGGETEIESLRRAAKLNRDLALRTIAEEIEQGFIRRPGGTYGITQALIYGFAKGGLGNSASTCFEIWDQGLAVIASRLPRVGAAENPEGGYIAPNPDSGANLLGDIDTAFAAATVAGLAHPSREQKRRSFLGIQVLINERASFATAPLGAALSSLSDPATLTWLLRVIELADEKAAPIIARSRSVLIKLAERPHLTVRTLARRIISRDDIPLVRPIGPEPELIDWGSTGILLFDEPTVAQEDTAVLDRFIDSVAGVRLSRAERILPGLSEAVRRRVKTVLDDVVYQRRMRAQANAYGANQFRRRRPDAFLASEEVVEDILQQTAAGARGASLMNYGAVSNPVRLEERLAIALLDDPTLPLAIEQTRHPRPDIPPPPSRGDPLWHALLERAEGALDVETGIAAAWQDDDQLFATIDISDSETVPVIVDGPYGGWRLVAAVEDRIISQPNSRNNQDDIAERFRIVELRLNGDQQALALPPVTEGDIHTWRSTDTLAFSMNREIQSSPIVGYDLVVRAADDGHLGLGIQRGLLTPTSFLIATLGLKGSTYFVLEDDIGQALALITWRTEYDTSDYYLPRPRLRGAGLVLRSDVFNRLVCMAHGQMIFRDFLSGPSNSCG
ncbi:MAG: ATP-binding protein [Bacteroidetes bacterium]|nr:ATP-binding protein [Bacteroidota bacterium]